MSDGILAIHLGWTDIVSCMSLINYHSLRSDRLYVFMRSDAKDLVTYYTRHLNNVVFLFESKESLDNISVGNLNSYLAHIHQTEHFDEPKLYFHGIWDRFRNDTHRLKFTGYRPDCHFVQDFYEKYGIPFIEKINSFEFVRDYEQEDAIYESFVKEHGSEYSLVHDSEEMRLPASGVQLSGLTNNPLLYVRVLQNAKEIHLIDSFWAAIIYQLDARYELFANKTINIYPFKPSSSGQVRGGGLFILPTLDIMGPVVLPNWVVHI